MPHAHGRAVVIGLLSACSVLAGAVLAGPRGEEPSRVLATSPAPARTSITPSPATPVPTATIAPATLLAAGDIAACGSGAADATARLLERVPGTIATLGDNAYERGTAIEFAQCFGPTWGRMRDRIQPALGNHEYGLGNANAYFDYFGAAAGPRGTGYYSYELGAWHVLVLNSECDAIGGCGVSSPEVAWLRADLAASSARCTIAMWHHPRWSSGAEHGSDAAYDTFWRVLYQFGVEVVLNGHDHEYERFAPQTPDAKRDEAKGIREFVVGTGGRSLYPVNPPIGNSEVLRNDTYGVLQLTLRAEGYDWHFLPVEGGVFTDSGTGLCH